MAKEQCILHWRATPSAEALISCTIGSFERIKEYCKSWNCTKSAQDIAIANRFMAALPENLNEEIPQLLFHRGCYHRFTLKSRLQKAKIDARRTTTSKVGQEVEPEVRFPNKCIFCRKLYKSCRRKKAPGYQTELLIRCRRPNVVTKIQAKVAELNDQELLAEIGGRDLIAEWAKYHESCYSTYVNKYRSSNLPMEEWPAMDKEAFLRFMAEEVTPQVQNGRPCVPMSAFSDLFNETIQSSKHLKSELPLFELRKHCPFLQFAKEEDHPPLQVPQSLPGVLQKPQEPADKGTIDNSQKKRKTGDMDSKHAAMLQYAQSLHSKIALVFAGSQEAPPPLELLNFLAACVDGSQLNQDAFTRLPNATRGKVTRIARNIVHLSAESSDENGTHLETTQSSEIEALAAEWLAMYGLV